MLSKLILFNLVAIKCTTCSHILRYLSHYSLDFSDLWIYSVYDSFVSTLDYIILFCIFNNLNNFYYLNLHCNYMKSNNITLSVNIDF